MRARHALFGAGALGLGAALVAGAAGLPRSGRAWSDAAAVLVRTAPAERHTLDVVAAVNFDHRGFDTLGEELILFAAVLGAAVLLRRARAEEPEPGAREREPGRQPAQASGAIRLLAGGLAAPCVLFGAYLVAHGQVSPGGGFQGGVVLATAPLVVYLSAQPEEFRRIVPLRLVRWAEDLGEGGYTATGLLGLALGQAFLQNVLPLGAAGDVLSAGTVLVLNLLVGLAVAAGLLVLMDAFLEKTVERVGRRGEGRRR